MARRRIVEEPTSRLAVWSRRCALFGLAVAGLTVVIVRAELVETEPALATLGAALALAALAILLALGAFASIWKDGIAGGGMALTGLMLGALLLAYPAYLGTRAYQLPAIADITTDAIDPPRFDVIARLRPRGTADYAGLYAAEQQRNAYPEIEPLAVSTAPQAAYDATLRLVNKRKWRVVVDRPPQAGRRDGQIEAVARTAVLGFREDVTIRVRPTGEGTRIDIRSASRTGRHDFGGNAARVKALLDEIETAVNALPEEPRPAPKPAPTPKKGATPARK